MAQELFLEMVAANLFCYCPDRTSDRTRSRGMSGRCLEGVRRGEVASQARSHPVQVQQAGICRPAPHPSLGSSAIMSALSHEQSTVKRLHKEMTDDGIIDDEVTAWQVGRDLSGASLCELSQLKKASRVNERGRKGRQQPGALQKVKDKKYMPAWVKAKRKKSG
eukprot:768622-Hanusia_phi.AAC.8